jgi:hypothetical protein
MDNNIKENKAITINKNKGDDVVIDFANQIVSIKGRNIKIKKNQKVLIKTNDNGFDVFLFILKILSGIF